MAEGRGPGEMTPGPSPQGLVHSLVKGLQVGKARWRPAQVCPHCPPVGLGAGLGGRAASRNQALVVALSAWALPRLEWGERAGALGMNGLQGRRPWNPERQSCGRGAQSCALCSGRGQGPCCPQARGQRLHGAPPWPRAPSPPARPEGLGDLSQLSRRRPTPGSWGIWFRAQNPPTGTGVAGTAVMGLAQVPLLEVILLLAC